MKIDSRSTALAAAGLFSTCVLGGGIAAAAADAPEGTVLLVNGAAPVDQSAAAAVSARLGGVVLLVNSASLPSATVAALDSLNPARVIVVGGQARVSSAAFQQIREAADQATVQRVAGRDRFETAARLAAIADAEPEATGVTGPAGQDGAAGSAGATGPAGPTGATGLTGLAGEPGATGPAGSNGADGATGPVGPVGATGPDGAPGPSGSPGLVGPAGSSLSVYQGETRLGYLTAAYGTEIWYLSADGAVTPAPTSQVEEGVIAFAEPGCTGTPYYFLMNGGRQAGTVIDPGAGTLYEVTSSSSTQASFPSHLINGFCGTNVSGAVSTARVHTGDPFTAVTIR